MVIIIICVAVFVTVCWQLYTKLMESSRRPSGFFGRRLMHIWDRLFLPMQKWGHSLVSLPKGSVVLDIGVGSGQSSRLLAQNQHIAKVIASDISSEAIVRMKETIQDEKIEIIEASVLALPFNDHSFDAVMAFQTHFHWQPFEGGIKEVYRTLKPGGSCVIVSESDKPSYHLKAYDTPEKMCAYLQHIGFIHVQSRKYRNWTSYTMTKK